ncbi:MAG: hypothetical protein IT428_19805 [Planctomycetaceae bacterium]|nr:hypothetical protein [Planctomycetaceae bacterium]
MDDADRRYLEWERQKWVEEYYRGLGSPSGDGSDGRPPRAGLGCLIMTGLVVGTCFVSWIPSAILVTVCGRLGIPTHWGMRILVVGTAAAFGLSRYREWSGFRRAAASYGIESIAEWRARRPGGPHRIPTWHFIAAVGLVLAILLTWVAPLNRAGVEVISVFLFGGLGGLLLGGPIGVVVQNIDRNRLEKIFIKKGPLPPTPASVS